MTANDKALMAVLFSLTGVLYVFVIIGPDFATSLDFATMQIPSGLTSALIPAIATLVAAFAGAWAAFQWQARKSEDDQAKQNIEAVNNAIINLIRKHHTFIALRNQFINEHRDDKRRHMKIMPAIGIEYDVPEIQYDSLGFMLSSEDPNVLSRLLLTEQEIYSTLKTVKEWSKLHLERVQPTIEHIQKKEGSVVPIKRIERELGKMDSQMLRGLTDAMVEGVDASIAAIENSISDLNRAAKNVYPGHAVIGFAQKQK